MSSWTSKTKAELVKELVRLEAALHTSRRAAEAEGTAVRDLMRADKDRRERLKDQQKAFTTALGLIRWVQHMKYSPVVLGERETISEEERLLQMIEGILHRGQGA